MVCMEKGNDCVTFSKGRRLTTKSKGIILILLIFDFIACLPLFMDYLPAGHDLVFHLYRIEGIAEGIRQGQGIVRLQSSQLNGFGYPVSIMYGDIFLYPVAFLRLLGLSVISCYRVYVFVINSITMILAYVVAKKISQSYAIALLASSLWTLSPYRLGDVYLRGSLGEYTALMFAPVIIYGLYCIFIASSYSQKNSNAYLWLSIGTVGVVVTHVLSVILIGFVLVIPFIVCLFMRHDKFVLKQLGLSFLFIILLSLFFVVPFADYYLTMPMVVTENHTDQSRIAAAQHAVEPPQLFTLFSQMTGGSNALDSGINGEMPFSIGWAIWLSVALFVFALVAAKINNKYIIPITLLCVAVVVAWMTTVFFPWQRHLPFGNTIISFISSIQFPWRFIGPLTILLIVVGCCGIVFIRQTEFKTIAPICITVLIGLSALEGGVATSSFINLATPIQSFSTSASDSATFGIMAGEYLPANVDRERLIAAIQSNDYPVAVGAAVDSYEKNGTTVTLSITSSGENGTVDLPLLWYKYYRVQTASGQSCDTSVGPNGVIRLIIPHGFSDTVTIFFSEPVIWKISAWTSGLTCLVLVINIVSHAIFAKKFLIKRQNEATLKSVSC